MQTCILALGVLVAGQIGDAGGSRYSDAPAKVAPSYDVAEATPSQDTNQPRAATQPPVSNSAPTGLTKVVKPADFLRNLSQPVGSEKLAGVPLSLAKAVQNARTRDEQTRRVHLYWELSQAVAEFQLASREELEIQSLHNGLGRDEQAWGLALRAVTARKQVARNAVRVTQLCLQEELGLPENNLPLPNDLPHCGAYETKFERIFRGRTSREAKQLGQLLPLLHNELTQRSTDSTAALQWLNYVRGQISTQSDTTQLLKAYERMALLRQTFVTTAYRYNANIARYTELAVPQEIAAGRLVAMLIQTNASQGAEWQREAKRGAIRRATVEEAVPQSDADRGKLRTFAEKNDERSILVSP